jgi:hypothetical protein
MPKQIDIQKEEPRYEDYAGMLYAEARKQYQKGRNVDFQDMLSNANLAFINALRTFDPEMGVEFSTHLYSHLKDKLWRTEDDVLTKSLQNRLNKMDQDETLGMDFSSDELNPLDYLDLLEKINSLSEPALEIVNLILHPPKHFQHFTDSITPNKIKMYLLTYRAKPKEQKNVRGTTGWSVYLFRKAMDELKDVFSNLHQIEGD